MHARTQVPWLYCGIAKSESPEVGPSYVYVNKPTRSPWYAVKSRKTGLARLLSTLSFYNFMKMCFHLSLYFIIIIFKLLKYHRHTVPDWPSFSTSNSGLTSPFTLPLLLQLLWVSFFQEVSVHLEFPNCMPSFYMLPNLFSGHTTFMTMDKNNDISSTRKGLLKVYTALLLYCLLKFSWTVESSPASESAKPVWDSLCPPSPLSLILPPLTLSQNK